jgi:hypothetical protein
MEQRLQKATDSPPINRHFKKAPQPHLHFRVGGSWRLRMSGQLRIFKDAEMIVLPKYFYEGDKDSANK